jgi:hypothetical protein
MGRTLARMKNVWFNGLAVYHDRARECALARQVVGARVCVRKVGVKYSATGGVA